MKRALLLLFLLAACSRKEETYTIYSPAEHTEHYVNNAVLTHFKGYYYCMWQASERDEDSADTHVMYAWSKNGRQWSSARLLAAGDSLSFTSPGGWNASGDTLIAFINLLSDIKDGGTARYVTSLDGRSWSASAPVLMADGSLMDGILEQDPHCYDSTLYGAAHFRPGLHVSPIFTADLSGRSGWEKGAIEMEDMGGQSRGLEPSLYRRADGAVVMLLRDQKSSFRKLASVSTDKGRTWSTPALTTLEDSRSKQCAGNLPDGRAFVVGNPANSKDRRTLAIAYSPDGFRFGEWQVLRDSLDLPAQRYPGRYKTLGYSYPKAIVHEGSLWISYSENKERVVVTAVPFHVRPE
ncbi:MAG: exo-alpha-sialidase [Bacteroidales bacterium]|nr:exo-alpha-sialidase [Bacteroidales bacterium]